MPNNLRGLCLREEFQVMILTAVSFKSPAIMSGLLQSGGL
jgi:hypothetical protein